MDMEMKVKIIEEKEEEKKEEEEKNNSDKFYKILSGNREKNIY